MSVTAFVGLWGSGKTLALTERVIERESQGFHILNNYGFDGGEAAHTLDDFVRLCAELPRRVRKFWAIDEIGGILPARGWADWPPAMDVYWQQGRKFGLEVGYTTQDFELVDKNVRRVTQFVVKCEGWGRVRVSDRGVQPVEYRPLIYVRTKYRAAGYGTSKQQVVSRDYRRLDLEVANRYDTYYLVDSMERLIRSQMRETKSRPLIQVTAP